MKRLATLLKRFWAGPTVPRIENLPFSPEEFARLVYSRRPDDMKTLANGLARPTQGRDAIQKA
jgi:hypothetical protein